MRKKEGIYDRGKETHRSAGSCMQGGSTSEGEREYGADEVGA